MSAPSPSASPRRPAFEPLITWSRQAADAAIGAISHSLLTPAGHAATDVFDAVAVEIFAAITFHRAPGVFGKLPTPPFFDISHSLVTPAEFRHITSVVPSPLKSPVAAMSHPAAPGVTGLLPRPPLAISHSLVASLDAFSRARR